MKQIIISLILAASTPFTSLCASEYQRESEKLTQERDRAVAAATEPIQRIYKTALETMLQRATEAKDLEGALQIREALEAVSRTLLAAQMREESKAIGTWKLENLTDGHKGAIEIHLDGTFAGGGKPLGKWEVRRNQLVLRYDNRGGHTDIFDFPSGSDKLKGKNTIGHNLTLERDAS